MYTCSIPRQLLLKTKSCRCNRLCPGPNLEGGGQATTNIGKMSKNTIVKKILHINDIKFVFKLKT